MPGKAAAKKKKKAGPSRAIVSSVISDLLEGESHLLSAPFAGAHTSAIILSDQGG
jgi:hypothetical protein